MRACHGFSELFSSEIGKHSRPRPPIPAGMPIGGDTGWFDNILSE
jgi:hypothetical protein